MIPHERTPHAVDEVRDSVSCFLAVSRLRAAGRALMWLSFSTVLGISTVLIYSRLDFQPTGLSNRMVDWSIAALALPVALAAAGFLVAGGRWLAVVLWPARLGITADAHVLNLRLGPFGRYRLDTRQMEVRYAYEMDDESEAGNFEALLPPDVQHAIFLPRMRHPAVREPIQRLILRVVEGSEEEVARRMSNVIEFWRMRMER